MAGVKITDLTGLGAQPAEDDVLVIVDVSEDVTKKITVANLFTDVLRDDGTLIYDEGSGTVTATAFEGDGSGLTDVSVGATTAVDIGTGTHYVMVRGSATGVDSVNTDGNLVYEPSTDTLSATEFAGDGSLVTNVSATDAVNATNVAITNATNTAGTYYLHMGDSAGNGNDGTNIHTDVTYSQATKTLTIDKIVLADLPTADPAIAGALWNDSGTIKISAG